MTIREELNTSRGPARLGDLFESLCLGDLLSLLVAGIAATETALNPDTDGPLAAYPDAGDATQLSAVPTCILDVIAVAGTGATGRLTLKQGLPGVVDPDASEVVWNGPGTDIVRFNAADAYTDVDIWYTTAADTLSVMERVVSQDDQV